MVLFPHISGIIMSVLTRWWSYGNSYIKLAKYQAWWVKRKVCCN